MLAVDVLSDENRKCRMIAAQIITTLLKIVELVSLWGRVCAGSHLTCQKKIVTDILNACLIESSAVIAHKAHSRIPPYDGDEPFEKRLHLTARKNHFPRKKLQRHAIELCALKHEQRNDSL
jgi:hypothetical protein